MNNMNGIGSYNAMQKNLYSPAAQSRKTAKADDKKTDETKKTNSNSVQLSDKAKALLQEMKKTYSNADIYVAEYESDEEAAEYEPAKIFAKKTGSEQFRDDWTGLFRTNR